VETNRQGTTLYSGILVLVATVVVIQLWLITSALDALLRREMSLLLPFAIASLVLFLVNAGLLWFVMDFDHRLQRMQRGDQGKD
jgi:cytochrome bd-type quinol oxidase subunit 2